MAGYGSCPYGISGYGTCEGSDSILTVAALIVQSSKPMIGHPMIVSGVGTNIVDVTRNDMFSAGSLDGSKWLSSVTGNVSADFTTGLATTLHKQGPAAYSISTLDTFTSGDVSVDYSILHDYEADVASSTITYAGLTYGFNNNNRISIFRVLTSSGKHQVHMLHINEGVTIGRGTIDVSTSTGRLRIVKHGYYVTTMHDDVVVSTTNTAPELLGIVKIFTDTGSNSIYTKVRFNSFMSNTGLMFNAAPVLVKFYELADKITGTIPFNQTVGHVNVTAFNHNGMVGYGPSAFLYPLVAGASLSATSNLTATIQNDSMLRDVTRGV